MVYARDTNVSVIRTRNEIERTLERYGADGFAYATQGNMATVIFVMENRRIPRKRTERQQRESHAQACRQKWRALLLVTW